MTDETSPAEIARRRASWQRLNANTPRDVARRCCPDARLVDTGGGPVRWRCETHDRWGWA